MNIFKGCIFSVMLLFAGILVGRDMGGPGLKTQQELKNEAALFLPPLRRTEAEWRRPEADPKIASPLLEPWHFGVLIIIAFGLLFRLKSQKEETGGRELASRHASHDLQLLQRAVDRDLEAESLKAPRTLLKNPYGPATAGLPMADRVEVAIEASRRVGRSVGAIVFDIPQVKNVETGARLQPSAIDLQEIARSLRKKLRSTDCVHIAEGGEIQVFVSLLARQDDLLRIANRLNHEVRSHCGEDAFLLPDSPGIAMYPKDG